MKYDDDIPKEGKKSESTNTIPNISSTITNKIRSKQSLPSIILYEHFKNNK